MPKNPALQKVLVIGSGPIVIGQAAEFDYAGTQACKALREEGLEVVLINSNPATIMTDETIADRVYIQPLTLEALTYVIDKERPDGLLPTLGGQTGLNLAVELQEAGVLAQYNVALLGTSVDTIKQAEDRASFKTLMTLIGEPVPISQIVSNVAESEAFAEKIGFPIIVRPAYTLGGTGGGIAYNMQELHELTYRGLHYSRIHQVLLERSVAGWKEIEYEVMRDANDTCIIVCNMENLDPIGIHTGDSIVVAPSQTLTDEEYHLLRKSAINIIRALKVEGGCNVQFALNPNSLEYYVIEVNPRVSRSSALASKATGYPIAKVAAKIAIGLHLHEIPNTVTGKTMACFEPTIDYIVTKFPKWPFDKFIQANRTLGTQMKATGEVMAIDRTFESSLLKAISSLEGKETGLRRPALAALSTDILLHKLSLCSDERLFIIAELFRRSVPLTEIHQITQIDPWFLSKIHNIVTMEQRLKTQPLTAGLLQAAEAMGFTDAEIRELTQTERPVLDALRKAHGIYPVYKMVDSCAAEFEAATPYYYSTYEQEDDNVIHPTNKVLVIGSGPIRIGQGIEFDYCSVHAAWGIQEAGLEAIIMNNNPETVSTDFDTADKLYFESLYIDNVMNVIREEAPKGVIVQFGGQTAINLAPQLHERGVPILGTSVESIDMAEDRERFSALLHELEIPHPEGVAVKSLEEALAAAQYLGYPVLVRPSYVIGGRAMQIVYTEDELMGFIEQAISQFPNHPIWMDKYLLGKEVEVDAIADGREILIPGIMEHIERTGVHSGDSFSVYPTQTLSPKIIDTLVDYTRRIAQALYVVGLMNIQFVVYEDTVYVLEVNPRASRTVPILSKVTQVPMVHLAVKTMLGKQLQDLGYGTGLLPSTQLVAVKAPVFSFQKLENVEVALSPEMKSTGEVLGVDTTYDKALAKAFLGAGYTFPKSGTVFVTLRQADWVESVPLMEALQRLGFEIVATEGTAGYLASRGILAQVLHKTDLEEIQYRLKQREINLIINTPTLGKDSSRYGFQIRAMAEQYGIPCFTALDTAYAYLQALKATRQTPHLTYEPLAFYRGTSVQTGAATPPLSESA